VNLLLLFCLLQPTDPVDIVREGFLPEINDFAHIGLVFDNYRWFDKAAWSAETTEAGRLVTFVGEIPDAKAVDAFHETYRYTLGTGVKSMKLASYYQLDEDKEKIRFTIRFLITEHRNFAVHSGSLGVFSAKKQRWRDLPLDNRALVQVIEGIYGNDNPYYSLVKGMPFK